ncbi:MAG: AAC(3) family N-acetyltransferase [Victivallaceae bacterium]|nr:AAC(3) family N-acetyltransferase [Victivallaceae bacterium]
MNGFSRYDLLSGLRSCGVQDGMLLGIHSSLRTVGKVAGGVQTVLDALRESVGKNGTLFMPSHNDPSDFWYQDKTPSNCGYLTEYFRQQNDTGRSLHPTHSDIACGPVADYLLAGHPAEGGEAEDCPFHRLAQSDGWILMIGVRYNACTLLHVAESLAKREYIKYPCNSAFDRVYTMITGNGRKIVYKPELFPGCSYNFRTVEDILKQKKLIIEGHFGDAACTLAKASDILAAGRKVLKENKAMFLCNRPECNACRRVKALMEQSEAS